MISALTIILFYSKTCKCKPIDTYCTFFCSKTNHQFVCWVPFQASNFAINLKRIASCEKIFGCKTIRIPYFDCPVREP